MRLKDKILLSAFALMAAASVSASYWRYLVREDIVYFVDEEEVPTALDSLREFTN